jgi:hypothetical protein
MKYRTILVSVIIVFSLFSVNCATMLKGYEDTVILTNAPDSIRVFTHDGIEIPVVDKIIRVQESKSSVNSIEATAKTIRLRSNKEYILHLKFEDKEKVITIYPKIGFGWALLDFICGIIPSFYDAYTGSWNRFPNVDAQF